jgi:hypothetical protein
VSVSFRLAMDRYFMVSPEMSSKLTLLTAAQPTDPDKADK